MNEPKWIPEYEGVYKITTDGKVLSMKRLGSGRGFIKEFPHSKGYTQHFLSKDAKRKTVSTHQLVARTYIPNPLGLKEINHKNGIKSDNRVENLEWCTRKENMKHAYESGFIYIPRGEKHHKSKLTKEQVLAIRNRATNGETYYKLSREYGIDRSNIRGIVLRKYWKHIK